jgi:hypothetical protein
MASSIWKVTSTKVGTIQPFSSEYDMEAFILNNPIIVGCVGKSGNPCIIRQQISTLKVNDKHGRIDLVGLAKKDESNEGKYELRIFELKKTTIDIQAVDQLNNYLQSWLKQNSARTNIKEWLKQEIVLEKGDLDDILDRPIGVLVGSRFSHEAVGRATQEGMLGIRLARFLGSDKDFYVVVEDEVGTIVSRQVIGWDLLLKKQLIKKNDSFITKISKDLNIVVKPVIGDVSSSSKNIVFDAATRNYLKKSENKIKSKAKTIYDASRTNAIKKLDSPKGIPITTATGLLYLAYEAESHRSYWVPGPLWRLKRTNKPLSELLEEAKGQ